MKFRDEGCRPAVEFQMETLTIVVVKVVVAVAVVKGCLAANKWYTIP